MKIRLISTLLLLAGCQFAIADHARSADADLKVFLEHYEPAVKKLAAFYDHLTMNGTYTQVSINRQTLEEFPRVSQFKLHANGELLRVEMTGEAGDESGMAKTAASVAAPRKSFALERSDGSDAFVLKGLRRDGQATSLKAIRARYYGLFSTFCDIDGVPILDRLKSEDTKIVSIQEHQRNDRDLVTVSITYRPAASKTGGKTPPEWFTSYTFSKGQGWALCDYERGQANSKEYRLIAHLEYDGQDDGIPILKHVEYWREVPGKRVKVIDCQIAQLTPGDVPQQEFSLAAFGIADVDEQPRSRLWIYLNVLGLALIFAALLVRRLRSRQLQRG